MKRTIIIQLVIDGDAAQALKAVNDALDEGGLQDDINISKLDAKYQGLGGRLKVLSATAKHAPKGQPR